MEIHAPFGYGEIVPLRKQHRVLVPAGNTPAFCRSINALAISFSEFAVAARDYPIVFTSLDGGKTFAPLVVLGLAEGSNLFVDAEGEWDRATYVPAYVRRYPFCISKLYVDGEPRSERVVCVAKAYLDPGGIEIYDAAGRPSARWQQTERLLAEYEADLDRTAAMCAAFVRLGILEPFTLQVQEGSARAARLGGMHRVAEARLRDLRPASHKVLVEKDFMGRIYAHLHSLENFARLYARQRAAQPAPSARKR